MTNTIKIPPQSFELANFATTNRLNLYKEIRTKGPEQVNIIVDSFVKENYSEISSRIGLFKTFGFPKAKNTETLEEKIKKGFESLKH